MSESDLSWFYNLDPHIRVALLRKPGAPLPGDLAARFAKSGPGVYTAYWVCNGKSGPWRLAVGAAAQLDAIRMHLDEWWSKFLPDERADIIENRDRGLDPKYAGSIHDAGLGPSNDDPNSEMVGVITDGKTRRIDLTTLFRDYVEMKATE